MYTCLLPLFQVVLYLYIIHSAQAENAAGEMILLLN